MLGVSLVGQHHVGRGIKCRLVQRRTGVHVLGIDIHRTVVAHQLQTALTSSTLLHLGIAQASLALLSTCATPAAVVVSIVAEVSVVHGGVHTVRSTRSRATAVFRPEEEASLLKHFTRPTHAYLPKVSCFIPAHIIKQAVLMVEHALHGVRLVLIAIAVTGFLVAFLAECKAIQRCSYFLTGYFNSETEGVKPHGFRAVYPFGFMCWYSQMFDIINQPVLLFAKNEAEQQ